MTPPTNEVAPAPEFSAPSNPVGQAIVPPLTIDKDLWPRPEDLPNVHELVIEDAKPVDNIFSEKQMRLLTEPLHSCWPGPANGQPFVAMANVGVFFNGTLPPIVPDALLAVGVKQEDLKIRENRAYFVWLRSKTPDVVVEFVSNREGNEDTDKLLAYARMPVPYYVIFDPDNYLRQGVLRVYQLQGRTYRLIPGPWFFEEVGLGVQLWQGRYEEEEDLWLRWCDHTGELIPSGAEWGKAQHLRADQAEQVAEAERQRAEQVQHELHRLREKLRAAGIDPNTTT